MDIIEDAYQKFCETRFPTVSEQQVSDLERRIGISLPEDYRSYLLRFNGGYFTEPDINPPDEGCPLDRLTFMYGIGAPLACAELASDLDLFDDNDPPQIMPVGYTLMGNLILLITHPENRGYIVLKKAFSNDSFFLAEGIEGFFGLLQTPPPDEEDEE